MIISHKHKFIFIKVRKTGGSSIEALLARHCDAADIVSPMPSSAAAALARNWEGAVPVWRRPFRIPELLFWQDTIQKYRGLSQRRQILAGNYYNHMRARDVRAVLPGKIWRGYYKFCCERNPWDKLLSRYVWQYHGAGNHKDPQLPAAVTPQLFTDYLRGCLRSSPSISDYSFYSDRRGKIMVDRVLRFEKLAAEFTALCQELGLPGGDKLGRLKASRRQFHYRDIYNSEQRQLVAAACAAEIAAFGYEF